MHHSRLLCEKDSIQSSTTWLHWAVWRWRKRSKAELVEQPSERKRTRLQVYGYSKGGQVDVWVTQKGGMWMGEMEADDPLWRTPLSWSSWQTWEVTIDSLKLLLVLMVWFQSNAVPMKWFSVFIVCLFFLLIFMLGRSSETLNILSCLM